MITRKRIAELRKAWPRDLQSEDLDAILDAAESALELRAKLDESIAWIESEQAVMSDQAFEASTLLLARLK